MGFVISPKVFYKNGMSYKINNLHDDDVFESGSGALRGVHNRAGVNSESFYFQIGHGQNKRVPLYPS